MNGYVIFWTVVIVFSLISFTFMSFKVLFKGWPELLEMFDSIKKDIASRTKESEE